MQVKRPHLPIGVAVGMALSVAYAGSTYERSAELLPIRLSYGDLTGLLNRVRILLSSANASVDRARAAESLHVAAEGVSLKADGPLAESDIAKAPAVAYEVRFRYYLRDAPVSTVEIDLYDFRRKVTVDGASPEHVDAVLAAILRELEAHSTRLGGVGFRLVVYVGIYIIGSVLTSIAKTPRGLDIAVSALLGLTPWLLPWNTWLPGAAVYATNADWVVRLAPEISLIGVVATLVVGGLGMHQTRRLSRRAVPALESEKSANTPEKR